MKHQKLLDVFKPKGLTEATTSSSIEKPETKQKKAKPTGIEVYGVKGMKSTPFTKKFKSQDAFELWLEKNEGDFDVQGQRDITEEFEEDDCDSGDIEKMTESSLADHGPFSKSGITRPYSDDFEKVVKQIDVVLNHSSLALTHQGPNETKGRDKMIAEVFTDINKLKSLVKVVDSSVKYDNAKPSKKSEYYILGDLKESAKKAANFAGLAGRDSSYLQKTIDEIVNLVQFAEQLLMVHSSSLTESVKISEFAQTVIDELTKLKMFDKDDFDIIKTTDVMLKFENREIDEVVTITKKSNGFMIKVVVDGETYINKTFSTISSYVSYLKSENLTESDKSGEVAIADAILKIVNGKMEYNFESGVAVGNIISVKVTGDVIEIEANYKLKDKTVVNTTFSLTAKNFDFDY